MSFFDQYLPKGTKVTKVPEVIKITKTKVRTSNQSPPLPSPQQSRSLTTPTTKKRKLQQRADTLPSSGTSSLSANLSLHAIKKQKSKSAIVKTKRTPEPTKLESSDEEDSAPEGSISPDIRHRASKSSETDVTVYSGVKRDMVNPESFTDLPLTVVHAREVASMDIPGYRPRKFASS